MAASITTNDLKALFKQAIIYLEVQASQFNSEVNYYSIVPTDEWQNLEQPTIVIGSLVDDALELKRVVAGKIPFSSVDLDRLASVLRAISQDINPV